MILKYEYEQNHKGNQLCYIVTLYNKLALLRIFYVFGL